MKKRLLAMLLAVVMAAGLLPGTALAADASAQAQSTAFTLSEEYLFAGTNGQWYTEEAYRASPWVGDLDGDGRLEVINAAYSLTVMDAATGAVKWKVNAGKDVTTPHSSDGSANSGAVFNTFKVANVDGDEEGTLEIVVGYGDGTLSVLDAQGKFMPGWPRNDSGHAISSLTVDDLDGDGRLEIIVGIATKESHPESVWVYHCDGTVADGWPQLEASQNGSYMREPEYITETAWSAGIFANGVTTGDLNGDGLPEIIAPTDTSFIGAFYYDGSLVKASDIYGGRAWGKIALWEDYAEEIACKNEGWGWGYELDSRATTFRSELANAGTVYTDLDNDGKAEIVITSLMMDRTTYTTQGNNTATIADTRYMTVFVLNQDRTRYVNEKLGFDWTSAPNELTSSVGGPLKKEDANSVSGNVIPVPTCADLDDDGYQEILFNSFDGMVHCFSLDKSEWCFELPKTTSAVYEYASPITCADLDDDGRMEVIFASWTDCEDGNERSQGSFYYNYGGTGVNGALYILDCDGNLLASTDLHTGYCLWEDRDNPGAGYTNGVWGAPTVADIDNDGNYEILLNTRYYGLCVYEVSGGSGGTAIDTDFDDVPEDEWYAAPVKWAVENGITYGTAPGKFSPDDTCTQAEILTFLWRAAKKPVPSTLEAPVAIDPGEYYATPVLWAAGLGMIDSSFNPDAPCSRADVARYIWKAFNGPGSAEYTPRFSDVSPEALGGYENETWIAINWVACNGITVGVGNNLFDLNGTCTRAEIVTFLRRAYVPETRVK